MANKYVQYGAVVATGVGAAALASGIKAYGSGAIAPVVDVVAAIPGVTSGGTTLVSAGRTTAEAIDAGTKAAGQTITNTLSNPAFLTTVGLGLVGLALGSGSKRPSLNFPNLAATAAVALNVANLIQQGKAAAQSISQTQPGKLTAVTYGALRGGLKDDPELSTDASRGSRQTHRLVYPNDLTENYYIRFCLHRYERLDKSKKVLSNSMPHTTIRLPIPSNLIDAISLAYQDVGLGMFGGAAFDNLMRRLNGPQARGNGQGEVMRHLTAGVGSLVDLANDPDFFQALARRLAGGLSPEVGAAFDLATGTAPNPHMAVSFQGVALKKYQFSWRLSPNNEKESKILEEVIRNLQASGLPEKQGQFLLTFPDVISVEMMPSNLFIFKPMMMDNVSINYAPSGSPSFYKSSTNNSNRYPTELELSISLREIDIHTASDDQYKKVREQQQISINNQAAINGFI